MRDFSSGLYKGKYFSKPQADEIIEGATKLLSEVGVGVPGNALQQELKKAGFMVANNRIKIEPVIVKEFLENYKKRLAIMELPKRRQHFDGMLSIYSYKLESFDQLGKTEIFTTDSLIRAAKFVEKCSTRYGFTPNVPGYARDVPPQLESLHKYMISANYCHAGLPSEPSSTISAEYMFEMAEVMGEPMVRLPIFPASPLNLSGESVDTALAFRDKITSAYVYAMSLWGITTPMSVPMGFSMNLAEVLGAAILMESILKVPVDIKPNLLPFDLRSFSLCFGSVEKILLEVMSADLTAQILDTPLNYSSTNIHTMAKTFGVQSAAEKTGLICTGALFGATKFYCIGCLSLDETFSPYQLILDLETMKNAEKLVNGMRMDSLPKDFVQEVQQSIGSGFTMSDRTLDYHEEFINPTDIFCRGGSNADEKYTEHRIFELVSEIDQEENTFSLDQERSKELKNIYQRALKSII